MNKYAITALICFIVVTIAAIFAEFVYYRIYIKDEYDPDYFLFWFLTAYNITHVLLAFALFFSQIALD